MPVLAQCARSSRLKSSGKAKKFHFVHKRMFPRSFYAGKRNKSRIFAKYTCSACTISLSSLACQRDIKQYRGSPVGVANSMWGLVGHGETVGIVVVAICTARRYCSRLAGPRPAQIAASNFASLAPSTHGAASPQRPAFDQVHPEIKRNISSYLLLARWHSVRRTRAPQNSIVGNLHTNGRFNKQKIWSLCRH